jgi:hypothetical protein
VIAESPHEHKPTCDVAELIEWHVPHTTARPPSRPDPSDESDDDSLDMDDDR